MKEARIAQLKKWLAENPSDVFLNYALATEYVSDYPEQAKTLFEKLLTEHPDYTATYYHAAQLYIQLGDLARAKDVFEKGILVCQQQQDPKALAELRTAYQNFLFEYE